MQKGELDSSPFFAFLLRRQLSNPYCGLLQQRLAPRARCVQLCFAFKPGGVIRPLRSSMSSHFACTPRSCGTQQDS
jgi:hypothetical protein